MEDQLQRFYDSLCSDLYFEKLMLSFFVDLEENAETKLEEGWKEAIDEGDPNMATQLLREFHVTKAYAEDHQTDSKEKIQAIQEQLMEVQARFPPASAA